MSTHKELKAVLLFQTGNIAVFDEGGQVWQLQTNLICQWAERASALGYQVEGVKVEVQDGPVMEIIKTKEGWNVRQLP